MKSLLLFLTAVTLAAATIAGDAIVENSLFEDPEVANLLRSTTDTELENDLLYLESVTGGNDYLELSPAEATPFGLILDHHGKKYIRNIVQQMPCGWPELGIPPLAPYRNEDKDFEFQKPGISFNISLKSFRIDGLNDVQIKKMKISYTFKQKATFKFLLPRIRAKGWYKTDLLIDFLDNVGLSVGYNGGGYFDVILENLIIEGSFRYKLPVLIGSTKIYKLNCAVRLGDIETNIDGLGGHGKANRLINDEIERLVVYAINSNQQAISNEITNLEPIINEQLKGHKLWTIIKSIATKPATCDPPTTLDQSD